MDTEKQEMTMEECEERWELVKEKYLTKDFMEEFYAQINAYIRGKAEKLYREYHHCRNLPSFRPATFADISDLVMADGYLMMLLKKICASKGCVQEVYGFLADAVQWYEQYEDFCDQIGNLFVDLGIVSLEIPPESDGCVAGVFDKDIEIDFQKEKFHLVSLWFQHKATKVVGLLPVEFVGELMSSNVFEYDVAGDLPITTENLEYEAKVVFDGIQDIKILKLEKMSCLMNGCFRSSGITVENPYLCADSITIRINKAANKPVEFKGNETLMAFDAIRNNLSDLYGIEMDGSLCAILSDNKERKASIAADGDLLIRIGQ